MRVGANVTVFDNSPRRHAQDRLVADREGLTIEAAQGDVAELSAFADGRFESIVHPVSNVFASDVKPDWREACRVLRPGGSLPAGFMNPAHDLLEFPSLDRGGFRVAHRIPYSDPESLTDNERARLAGPDAPPAFVHTLSDRNGGQLAAGFVLTGFYEEIDPDTALGRHIASNLATRAVNPGR